LKSIGFDPAQLGSRFEVDSSDHVCATFIIETLRDAPPGTLIAVDDLQLLDQRRENPTLAEQVVQLKSFADQRGLVIVFLSQMTDPTTRGSRPSPNCATFCCPIQWTYRSSARPAF